MLVKYMKKIIATLLLSLTLIAAAAPTQAAFGDALYQFFGETVEQVYQKQEKDIQSTLPQAVGNIIGVFLGFVSVILLVIVIYAGFLWLTARGNTSQVEKAQQLLRNGIIGMVITLGAFIITSFVVNTIDQALRSDRSNPRRVSMLIIR